MMIGTSIVCYINFYSNVYVHDVHLGSSTPTHQKNGSKEEIKDAKSQESPVQAQSPPVILNG